MRRIYGGVCVWTGGFIGGRPHFSRGVAFIVHPFASSHCQGSPTHENRLTTRRLAPFAKGPVAGIFIELETTPTLFGMRWCEPKNHTDPQIAIGTAGGDALTWDKACRFPER
jgi:hypothetical protein